MTPTQKEDAINHLSETVKKIVSKKRYHDKKLYGTRKTKLKKIRVKKYRLLAIVTKRGVYK
jgi:hypothetical protein